MHSRSAAEALAADGADEQTRHAPAGRKLDAVGQDARPLGLVEPIDLVEDDHLLDLAGADLVEHPLDLAHLLGQVGAGRIDDVQQQVGIGGFLQGRLERLDQRVRQVADEADRVGQGDAALDVLEMQLAGGGVEGREQLVGGVGLGVDQAR